MLGINATKYEQRESVPSSSVVPYTRLPLNHLAVCYASNGNNNKNNTVKGKYQKFFRLPLTSSIRWNVYQTWATYLLHSSIIIIIVIIYVMGGDDGGGVGIRQQ